MKNAFRLSLFALMFVCLSAALGVAQTPTPTAAPSPTPDPFVTQITSSIANTFVGGISGNGRFVVFESAGDLATLNPGETTRTINNTDGNREIFLYDYAQRRIFQITNTTSARRDTTRPALPSLNPTVAPDFSNVDVEVSNNRPVISRDGRWIVFSSNADTPFNFDGDANSAALRADGNQEIFLYRIPDVSAVDLRSGTDTGFINLRRNAFTRVTNTVASRLPVAGTASTPPIVADDNRLAQLNDRGSRLVFVSTRNEMTGRNADFNPEIFVWRRTSNADALTATGTFTQVTNTTGAFTFNDNPSISGDTSSDTGAEDPRSVIAFVSNATVMRDINDATIPTSNADGNGEIFVSAFNGSAITGITQATRTRRTNLNDLVNLLNPGPHLSRDGRFLTFETVATDPKADTTTNQDVRGLFVYVIATDTFIQIGPRGENTNNEDVLRFPTFTGTGDSTQLVFTSALNFTASGTRVAPADASGLNPSNFGQIYSVPVPPSATAAQAFTRLTNTRNGVVTQPFASNTTERLAFSFNAELGGGNSDLSAEVFYLNVQPAPSASDTSASASALSYFTGATAREVVTPAASPTPTPSPTPSATPISGLAPGMIGIVRAPQTEGAARFGSTTTRACPPQILCDASSESQRRPPLPVELGGVSLSINNAAAGLYFVSPTEIQFVVPAGLAPQTGATTYPVVVNVNQGGAVRSVRSVLQVVAAQPDIYSSTNGPGGRAVISNVTNPLLATGMTEPFNVTTTYVNSQGQSVTEPTRLRVMLTGVRGIARSAFTVRLVKADGTNTDIAPGDQIPSDLMAIDLMPGAFTLDFRLPATLAGAGDVSIILLVNAGGQTFMSRPVETAPRFRIN